jgi:selenide,water dikinase
MDDIRLTEFATGGGCARKLAAADLVQVLHGIAPFDHPWVDPSVGPMDDAALIRPPGATGLIFTVDFITPIVDDPETYGAIAAANAMSDVYAMGGEPQVAVAVCGFPSDKLPREILTRIFRGGRDKAAEAGCAIAGGHTMNDGELKYGLCVIGSVEPGKELSQTGARVGDVLVLTKPIGLGVASQAVKKQRIGAAELDRMVTTMTTLNKGGKDAAHAAGAHAATDVTGFGLLGHLRHLLLGGRAAARISARAVPVLDFVPGYLAEGLVPGGSKNNLKYVDPYCRWDSSLRDTDRQLLADAQTSGGLLIAVPPAKVDLLLSELERNGTLARAVVGEIVAGEAGTIRVDA